MDVQTILVLVAGLLAAAYLARRAWKTWASKGCGSGCGGCGARSSGQRQANLIAPQDLLARVRRAQGGTEK